MFESEFDFGKFTDFFAFFLDKVLKSIFQTSAWLKKTAKSFE